MPMVSYGEREISHEELRAEAARTAAGLVAAGVQHGDRVALVLRNDPTFLSLSAACGLIGAVPVPVNWHWHGLDLGHVITHSDSRVVFAHSDFVANVETILPEGVPLVEVPVPTEITARYGPAPVTGRRALFAEWIGGHEPYAEPLDAAPMSLIYTSGTTGLPKGVIREVMTPSGRAPSPRRRWARWGCAPTCTRWSRRPCITRRPTRRPSSRSRWASS
jgi:long-chain acyl-CoA synthetase